MEYFRKIVYCYKKNQKNLDYVFKVDSITHKEVIDSFYYSDELEIENGDLNTQKDINASMGILYFQKIVSSLNQEELNHFLAFFSGSSVPPLGGLKPDEFKISKTCLKTLFFVFTEDYERTREKLIEEILSSSDFVMNGWFFERLFSLILF